MAGEKNPITVSKIGIIGAGVSGIAAAKQLSNHNPMVFEATDSIGGVWRHCSYNSTRLQSPQSDYEFSDYPWPQRDNSTFPTYVEILDYLHSYAVHFDLLKYVKFNSKVVEVRYVGDSHTTDLVGNPAEYRSLLSGWPVWQVAVQANQSENVQVNHFEK